MTAFAQALRRLAQRDIAKDTVTGLVYEGSLLVSTRSRGMAVADVVGGCPGQQVADPDVGVGRMIEGAPPRGGPSWNWP